VPVLCDAQDDGNINPELIESFITPRTKAVIITSGVPCDITLFWHLKHSLKLIEDCACPWRAYAGSPIGSHGDVAAFSIQGPKIITGEGGVLLMNDTEIYERCFVCTITNAASRRLGKESHITITLRLVLACFVLTRCYCNGVRTANHLNDGTSPTQERRVSNDQLANARASSNACRLSNRTVGTHICSGLNQTQFILHKSL
jgi:hypothetical protein